MSLYWFDENLSTDLIVTELNDYNLQDYYGMYVISQLHVLVTEVCVCIYIYIYTHTQVHLKQLEYGEKVTCKVKHFKVFFVLILMIRAYS